MKRFLAVLMACTLLFCGGGMLLAQAADTNLSGTCGENLTWTLQDGTLTVSGTGDMQNFSAYGLMYIPEDMPPREPWIEYKKDILSIVIGEGVTSVGNGAFQSCVNATAVTLPQTLTSIGVSSFYSCRSLDSISIPQSVTAIKRYAFCGCGGVTVDAANRAYADTDGILFSKDQTRLLHYPINRDNASYTLPDSVRSVEEYAFADCRYLRHLTVTGNLEKTDFAFMYCTSLQSATISEGVTKIGYDTFFGCKNLRSVVLPNGLTSIANGAFYDTALECLYIPSSVTEIESYSFFTPKYKEDDIVFPYMQKFYLCADTADSAAKAYADENQIRFYLGNTTRYANTIRMYNSFLQRVIYVLQSEMREIELLSALIQYFGNRLKMISAGSRIA